MACEYVILVLKESIKDEIMEYDYMGKHELVNSAGICRCPFNNTYAAYASSCEWRKSERPKVIDSTKW